MKIPQKCHKTISSCKLCKMGTKKKKNLQIICPLVSILSILLLWTIFSIKIDSEYILPSFFDVIKKIVKLLGSKTFYIAVANTILRVLLSFLVSFLLSLSLSFFAYKNKVAQSFIVPFIKILRALPTIAIVLLLLFWTSSKTAPIIVTMLVIIPTLYTDLFNAFCGIDKELTEMCIVFNVSKRDRLFKVEFPQVLPSLLYSVGAGLSLNFKLMVAAEVIAQTAKSLGYLLNTAKVYYEIAEMLALVLVVVVLAVVVESIFCFFAKKAGKNL